MTTTARDTLLRAIAAAALFIGRSALSAQQPRSCAVFDAGARHVVVSAATAGALHIRISIDPNAPATHSIFPSPGVDDGSASCQMTRTGDTIRVRSTAGALAFTTTNN